MDKPAGWLSVPSRMGADDPRPCVGTTLQSQLGERLWPVHRLDEEVSGLLLFARNAEAHRRLCSGFEEHRIAKTYQALCEGAAPAATPLLETRRLTTKLLRGKRRAYVHADGKLAITDVTLLSIISDSDGGLLRFALQPQTGRSHQLRVELSRLGCPILGDTLYGARRPFGQCGIALRAVALDFQRFGERAALALPPLLEVSPLFTTTLEATRAQSA